MKKLNVRELLLWALDEHEKNKKCVSKDNLQLHKQSTAGCSMRCQANRKK